MNKKANHEEFIGGQFYHTFGKIDNLITKFDNKRYSTLKVIIYSKTRYDNILYQSIKTREKNSVI